jgi:hypothetical protein
MPSGGELEMFLGVKIIRLGSTDERSRGGFGSYLKLPPCVMTRNPDTAYANVFPKVNRTLGNGD